MRVTDWDRVITSAPLDRTAAIVRDQCEGEVVEVKDFDGPPAPARRWSERPPLASRATSSPQNTCHDGRQFGRLTIIGTMSGSRGAGKGRGPILVCQCECGTYEGYRIHTLEAGRITHCTTCEAPNRLRRAIDRARGRAA